MRASFTTTSVHITCLYSLPTKKGTLITCVECERSTSGAQQTKSQMAVPHIKNETKAAAPSSGKHRPRHTLPFCSHHPFFVLLLVRVSVCKRASHIVGTLEKSFFSFLATPGLDVKRFQFSFVFGFSWFGPNYCLCAPLFPLSIKESLSVLKTQYDDVHTHTLCPHVN